MIPNQINSSEDLEAVFYALNEDIYGYIMGRVRSQVVAEDIAQEVFVKAWEKRTQFNSEKGSLKNWIYGIALNAVYDYFRRQKNRRTEELREDFSDAKDIKSDTAIKLLHSQIMDQMQFLSQKDQDVLLLRYAQELSVEEIAEVMNMNYSATKVALHRATKKLKERCNRFMP
ncbi:hypothetical protein COU78_01185 [Candidatus Peregrinibacteria bacterium CG10_big_fil_rev_8_21_14_0_10_49_24]|nr:MAG: hypothetical protein COV83_04150 [Candidatus Peregrinibacteria bacterium CG11_big_fil_rev_8_21_14_0_20_49_14]PIR51340.1 MAG: hypothetical protein COU78_01185 [Candidatus Peregrinibacteria bacterium CG10_big_fil_rev_8_21_14_0_10_49_24]PJA68104.1 MAG: hypothetical protein CO157_01000 [Candidatus Peregrinibacteria bacterium CG_4_9_14_3_um_filter_49_12]